MTQEETQSIQKYPSKNHDIFAWTHSDMKGIHPSIASHKLNVFPTARPIRQKIRRFHPDRQRVIQDEINKLLEAGFIREVSYPDCFPLPRIDQIVDSTSGQGMLSSWMPSPDITKFPMSPDDEEKTAFITPHGLYCYKVMPFGLKNAGATYQRLMTKIFKPLIGRSVEVYIDDIVVKSKTREQHILHLQEVFYLLRKYGMKLNPSKCAFGVSAGNFWDLCDTKSWNAGMTDNCQNALERIKHCLMHPPILSSPIPKEKLYMYLAVSEWAISAALFRCPSPKEQKPVYYVSRALADVETRTGGHYELTEPHAHQALELGSLLQSPTGEHLEQAIRLGFSASNNEAEYEAILSGLDLALAYPSPKLRIYSDSQLVLPLPIKEAILLPIHVQANPSVAENSTCNTIEATKRIIKNGRMILQNISGQALYPKILNKRTKSGCSCPFHPDGGHLYKRSFTGPYLRCLGHSEAQYVLAELHEGICGNHTGGRSLAHRAHSQGYYWPTMKKDAAAYVQKCDKCQRYAPIPHAISALKSVSGPWPFAHKWVEAEAYASIKDKDVTKFVWKNIVCRFGIPQIIIADNGPQFDSIAFRNFCSELNIRNSYSTPRYPQSNGQAEATNKTLINALKKRLEQAKGKWVEELPGVLWAYRTTPGRPTGNTPFALTYGMDAVIPTEIGLPTIRTDAAKQKDANTELGRNLDWADEVRESAPSGWQIINKEHQRITIEKSGPETSKMVR
ncbi:Retrovirus-related Pol polyprotein from transposon 17.6 [Vitis vinifera]|uniref:Retrovirus-related Pol polyprotein from transposon 17.6 n=1 Tax=Vitis vinifera TaxID=29760 RepID=A0A438IVV1_VITVI|nr:Retrovirus-related Pol polyprotein from transposon 17.6 [Vitis vinifera]